MKKLLLLIFLLDVIAGLGADATGACAQDPEKHSSARRPLHTDRQDGQG